MRLKLSIFLLASVAWGQAQSIHTIGAADAACLTKAKVVQQQVMLNAPTTKWQYAVICDKQTWDQVACNRYHDCSITAYAFTIVDQGWTFFNAVNFGDEQFTQDYIVRHELGHVMTGSTSCKKADQWAKEHR